ncbi:MAG: DHH family phosphoesterase [Candidatus Hydrogenedentota bacterium]
MKIKELYVSHGDIKGSKTDFDAVGSVASLVRKAKKLKLIQYENYDYTLIDYYNYSIEPLLTYHNKKIYLSDIPAESILFSSKHSSVEYVRDLLLRLKSQNNELIYVDHHPVSDVIRNIFYKFYEENLFLYLNLQNIDPKASKSYTRECATEMIQKYLFHYENIKDDNILKTLRTFARDQDLGFRKLNEATRISVVIGSDYNNKKLIEYLSDGIFWNDELQERYEYSMKKTQRLCQQLITTTREISFYKSRNKIKRNFVFALTPKENGLKSTPAAIYLFDKYKPDFVVILNRHGFLSIRRDQKSKGISAGLIAKIFGGGGHETASAAGNRKYNSSFPFDYIDESSFEAVVNKLVSIISKNYPP